MDTLGMVIKVVRFFSSFNPNSKGYYRRNNDFVFSETKRVKEFQGAKKNATT
ncbi:hypothetical protein VO54_00022 [Elizabethkingia miricola]|nr:hypothetical protein VO54_00022 [Elizabethkingia miricola]